MSPIPSETHSLYIREKQCSLCMGFWFVSEAHVSQNHQFGKSHHIEY